MLFVMELFLLRMNRRWRECHQFRKDRRWKVSFFLCLLLLFSLYFLCLFVAITQKQQRDQITAKHSQRLRCLINPISKNERGFSDDSESSINTRPEKSFEHLQRGGVLLQFFR